MVQEVRVEHLGSAFGIGEEVGDVLSRISTGFLNHLHQFELLVELDDHVHNAGWDFVHERLHSGVGGVHVGERSLFELRNVVVKRLNVRDVSRTT